MKLSNFGTECISNYSHLQEYAPGFIIGSLLCFMLLLSSLAYKAFTWVAILLISAAIMVLTVTSSPLCVTLWSCCHLPVAKVQYEEL